MTEPLEARLLRLNDNLTFIAALSPSTVIRLARVVASARAIDNAIRQGTVAQWAINVVLSAADLPAALSALDAEQEGAE